MVVAHPVLDQVGALLRLRSRHRKPVREQTGQAGRGGAPEHQREHPGEQDLLAVPDYEAGPAGHAESCTKRGVWASVTRITPDSLDMMPALVEVWVVPLDREDEEIRRLRATLSPDERERAGEAPTAQRKRRYVARQAALRSILADRIGSAPGELRFTRSTRGKPALEGDEPGLQFSVSDSAGLALVALAERQVGIDVEQIRDRPAARRAAALGIERFFERWSRMEATGKAVGAGVLGPREPGILTCRSLDVGPGFAAAVAVAAVGIEVRLRTY
jgi:phosphopantetheinyl transferase